ncbi:DUF998 domain-containing protein [Tengunoibacter tsumagoiensis]|uniref:DUF998 domain-containing protein n=1 Tax=Tengunoibacter tsumagoiensis TaxID=2014871 RepID=A0A402A9L1_9CHLR|nr:DUF998 domain-containing protein [Tengunoibacter tsumagoiensis]GCE15645.1 hypothetical protein KTT_55040 [Tengunoibacter tsumagoiensis]
MSSRLTPSISITVRGIQHRLLWAGIIAPILFAAVIIIDGLFKSGYSAADEAISYLEVGVNGWIQQTNFIIFGLLLIVFTVGYILCMRPIVGRVWISIVGIFLVLSHLGWIIAGLFVPNPYLTPQNTVHAILHQLSPIIIFLFLAIASLVLGVKLVFTRRWRAYGWYCLIIGLLMTVFPIVSLVYLITPALVGNFVGNVNSRSPNDGWTNRIVLLVGPIAWYLISATVVMLHVDQKIETSKGLEV